MRKILIAEDSPTVLAILKSTLEDAGYSVVAVMDGQEALARQGHFRQGHFRERTRERIRCRRPENR